MDLAMKRSLYKCGSNFTMLQNILTWATYFTTNLQHSYEDVPDVHGMFATDPELNTKVSLWKGDITTLEIDGIVNAANESLLGGGGVDGCIHDAAGEDLVKECKTIGGCPTGESRITSGYKLPAKYVIHTVGPTTEDHGLLLSSYKSALELAVSNNLRSVAFPCISTGAYGFPQEQAAHVALRTTRHFLEKNRDNVDRIIFVPYLEEDLRIYERLMPRYFPLPKSNL
jgi:O-acetyl-ADP-ribose deacetylase (regulator of RNase III)